MSNTAANPANPRPHTGAGEPGAVAESVNAGPEELLFAAHAGEMNVPLDADAVTGWIGRLIAFDREISDAERIDQLRALERLKAAAAAAQARISVDLDASARAADAAHGVPADRQGRGVAGQIAFARQESPYRGRQHLGLGTTLVGEMPHTLAALEQGLLSEWRATLLARETACLSREHRRLIDARLCADPAAIEGWGDRRLVTEIQQLACQLDAAAVARRRSRAESERRVSCRPAPGHHDLPVGAAAGRPRGCGVRGAAQGRRRLYRGR